MKVKPTDATLIHSEQKHSGRTNEISHDHPTFATVFKNSAVETRKQVCTTLLKKIDESSAELRKSPTPEGIRRYRQLVKEFMKEALSDAYQVDSEAKWDRMGNRREFVLVKKINQSLEELMDAFTSQEKKQLDLIAKLDEIRGMLIDLYC